MASSGSEPPLIGISCYLEQASYRAWNVPAAVLPQDYVAGVVAAGGAPVLLPPAESWRPAHVSRLDGLVLAGGPDIDPARYGSAVHPRAGAAQPERDETELRLLDGAIRRGVPVLGICRGMQLLAVKFGTSLHQHLPEEVGHDRHRPGPAMFGRVEVKLAPGSKIAGILGETVEVPCHHHQALVEPGDGLVAAGWAADGTIEAVESPEAEFLLGVQWHPEEDSADRRLFAALVEAAGKRGSR